ncbi:MAG: N-acetylmuramoyl-L-alanine amidase [Myxococcaceae bacterium]|nr:MAG: N-acetylmuramoyl-L-alanine amidase [Myxococcaceae bacterium]
MAVVVNPTRLLVLAIGVFALPALAAPDPAEQAYQAARKGYYALKKDPKRRKYRDSWLTVAHRFETVAKKYPKSGRAPDSLFTAAQLLSDLSRISLLAEDATASMEDYRALVEGYPKSSLADDAALALARAHLEREQPESARKVLQGAARLPRGDQSARLRSLAASLPPEPKEPVRKAGKGEAVARRETPSEARTSTREASADAPRAAATTTRESAAPERQGAATTRAAESRAASSRPEAHPAPALTVRQAPGHTVETPEWLKQVTAPKSGGNDDESGREASGDEAESESPVDRGPEPAAAAATEPEHGRSVASSAPAGKATRGTPDAGAILALAPPTQVRERLRAIKKRAPSEVTLAEQLGLKFRRVVIDPGHGGHDTGTVGADGTREKDVALAIAKKLRTVLTDQGLEVVLTRETDKFVRLEERARLANVARGDLFISIHCNSLPQRNIRGIETYTLNLASNGYAIRLAARENATSEKGMSDLRFLLADLATRADTEESVRLATHVQSGLVSALRSKDGRIRDLGTKEALFYVLLGTKMPAILVETGFLTNAEEEKRLGSPGYQEDVARAIASGVQGFLGNRDRLAKAN